MKSLLVCTDFSEAADHAARYSCMLARQCKLSHIVLLHAWHSMITSTALPVNPNEEKEQSAVSLQQLKKLKEQLMVQADKCIIHIRSEQLSLGESINKICEEENTDMVVMGMTGKTKLEKFLIGSTTVNVLQNSKYPVLVVPFKAPIKPVSHILLAYDLNELTATTPLGLLDEVMKMFTASLTVLNVGHKNRHFSPQAPEEMYQMHHIFDRYKPKYAFTENEDIVSGILDYAEKNSVSLIITIPRNYDFLGQLFHRSTTQKLVYESLIPLLTLHQQSLFTE